LPAQQERGLTVDLDLGASYGWVLGVKCAVAGHQVDLMCRASVAACSNRSRESDEERP
jgi:hypothetical protein